MKCTSASFEMNALTNNQTGQFENKKGQSRSKRFTNNINKNVKNFKNKLNNNFIKKCKFKKNHENHQETSFIDCENHVQNSQIVDLNEATNEKLNLNIKVNKKLKKTVETPLLDQNENFKNHQIKEFEKNGSFEVNFVDDQFNENDAKSEVILIDEINEENLTKNKTKLNVQTDQNDQIINEFLIYTNEIESNSNKLSTNENNKNDNNLLSTDEDLFENNVLLGNKKNNHTNSNQIQKPRDKKNYYNCSDKLLDVSKLPNSNSNQFSILDKDEQQNSRSTHTTRNQFNSRNCASTAIKQQVQTINASHEPKIILRRHVKKEGAADVKSARKQVSIF